MRTGDVENGNDASTEALSESRTTLSEWQTDPELKFYGRTMSSANSKRRDARPSLGRQRTIKHWLRLFGHRSKSEKALASSTSPRSPKTIPRVATP